MSSDAEDDNPNPQPKFFDTPGVDELFAVCMALAEELAVADERYDTLKHVLIEKNVMTADDIEKYQPSAEVEHDRLQRNSALVRRVLHVFGEQFTQLEKKRGDPAE